MVVKKTSVILNNPLSLKELAMQINLTDKNLSRVIKSNSMDYILKNPDKIPVEDIAMLLEIIGYSYIIEDDFQKFIENNILNQYTKDLPGSPVIAIVGHIDHGKTSLVESMTGVKLCHEEEGSITQKITSYQVKHKDRYIRVIDTPGHSLFKKARNLAMDVCDLVILIVSAADGIQQQTIDSIKFLQEKNMPFITVITKIDLNKKYESLYGKLSQYKIFHSSMGGDHEIIPVSAKTSENMEVLMDHILYLADEDNLTSDIQKEGYGYVLDSWKDNKFGIVCSLLLQDGSIKVGDTLVFEDGSVDKVRMLIANGVKQSSATKYDCIEIHGVDDYVDTSEKFWICNNKKNLDKIVELIEKSQKQLQKELDILSEAEIAQRNALKEKINTNLLPRQKRRKRKIRIVPVKAEKPDKDNIKFVLCGDSQNDVSALEQGIHTLQSENKIGQYTILGSILGAPTDFDLDMIATVQAYLVCFNVNISPSQSNNIVSKKITFFHNSIIYKVLTAIEEHYNNQFNYEDIEEECGTAEVIAIFKVQKKFIAGCIVRSGLMIRNKKVKLTRNGGVIAEGNIESLKNEANDLKEGKNNQECGIFIPEIKIKYQLKDILVCYRIKRIVRTPNKQIISEKYI
jgi:translation initiation factor IF-2